MDERGYKAYVSQLRHKERKIAEVSKLGFLPSYQASTSRTEHLSLIRVMVLHAINNGINSLIISVSRKKCRYYESMLLYTRLYDQLSNDLPNSSSIPLTLDLNTVVKKFEEKYSGRRNDLHQFFFSSIL